MDKVNRKGFRSIKWEFIIYVPICVAFAILGAYAIGVATNELQDWYMKTYMETDFNPHIESYEIVKDKEGIVHYQFYEGKGTSDAKIQRAVYWVISYTQVLLIPAWVLLCVFVCGCIFYKRVMETPIKMLMDASEKISHNNLDFEISLKSSNELGTLCKAFEDMRNALYKNNQETWRVLDERKKINAAFSHDMRTPITVLKGYVDYFENYVPQNRVTTEKMLEILGLMQGQISRLENYTYKMSSVQKMEDIIPAIKEIDFSVLLDKCIQINKILSEKVRIDLEYGNVKQKIFLDDELVLEVYENLLSNAVRYAKSAVSVWIGIEDEELMIIVEDDGDGFSDEAIVRAIEPFYRGNEDEDNNHFGMGLFICKGLCKKMGGRLLVQNGEKGAKIIATFSIKN